MSVTPVTLPRFKGTVARLNGSADRGPADEASRYQYSRQRDPAGDDERSMYLDDVLIRRGLVTREQLDQELGEFKRCSHHELGRLLLEREIITASQLRDCLAEQLGIEHVTLSNCIVDSTITQLVPSEVVTRYRVIPMGLEGETLVVATAEPFDDEALNAVRFSTRRRVRPVIADRQAISETMSRYFAVHAHSDANGESTPPLPKAPVPADSTEYEASRKPIVRLVDAIISGGIHRGASDINIRPDRDKVDVFYRVDGTPRHAQTLDLHLLPTVVARIKILSQMNIAERRLPQDGGAHIGCDGRKIDLRVSVIPTAKGESVVIRVLDRECGLRNLDDLGLSERDAKVLRRLMSRPNGVFLTTGPTGSGKSTTLNSMLMEVRRGNSHVITVEDPVEYEIAGVEQIHVNPAIGFSFAESLRHILRHDPDVIMVGEIRDLETARLVNKAALTGHLVFSTLHTNDAASAVSRLVNMGLEPFLLAASLRGVLAQRLIRINCRHCAEVAKPDPEKLEALNLSDGGQFMRGAGCIGCGHTGYRGRRIVYELLEISPRITQLIEEGAASREIHEAALEQGMTSLTTNAVDLAKAGVTSVDEAFAIRLG